MRNLLIMATGLSLWLSSPAQADTHTCPQPGNSIAAQSGQMLQAMVEFWWYRKRLPMRVVPDHVVLKPAEQGRFRIEFRRQGCPILEFQAPEDLLRRFLIKRLGPEI